MSVAETLGKPEVSYTEMDEQLTHFIDLLFFKFALKVTAETLYFNFLNERFPATSKYSTILMLKLDQTKSPMFFILLYFRHDFQWMRVNVIGDIRNYLLAASRNLTSAQYCLRGTRLPYCDVNEVCFALILR